MIEPTAWSIDEMISGETFEIKILILELDM